MSIVLPDFSGRECAQASFCGFVPVSEHPDRNKLAASAKALVASYEKSGETVLVRLVPPFPGDDDEDLHVHFDLAAARRFKKPPKVNTTIEDILDRLDPLVGKNIKIRLDAIFVLPLTALPPIIRATMTESSAGETRVRMTGGRLKFIGAPVDTLAWEILDKEGKADITLTKLRTESQMSDSYLVEGLDTLETTFKAFMAGEKSDGPTN